MKHRLAFLTLAVVWCVVAGCSRIGLSTNAGKRDEFMRGADISLCAAIEKTGSTYKENGQPRDILEIFKSHGCNYIRLRLWTDPAEGARPGRGQRTDLAYTLPLAKRVKAAGLQLLLNFHYSDTWADPGHQTKPTAWRDLSGDALAQKVYEYTRDTIAAFKREGALPDSVHVGNEIITGMIWPDGDIRGAKLEQNRPQFIAMLKAAIRGVKDGAGAGPAPKILMHVHTGSKWGETRWFFDMLDAEGVEYDQIALSFYTFRHGELPDLQRTVYEAARRYRKPVVVAEVAYPWTEIPDEMKKPIAHPATPEGQRQFTKAAVKMVMQTPNGLGGGVLWWGAEYIPMNNQAGPPRGWSRLGLFDNTGNALPALDALGRTR